MLLPLCSWLLAHVAALPAAEPLARRAAGGAVSLPCRFLAGPQQPLLDELAPLAAGLGGDARRAGVARAGAPVPVSGKATYQAYMKQYFPKVPYRRALFIKARGPGMVFACQGTDFEIDVRHESTHALLHAWLPSVPLWLDEGLAEYFEVAARRAGRRAIRTWRPSEALVAQRATAAAGGAGSAGRSWTRWAATNIATPGPGCTSCCTARPRPARS